MYWHRVTNRGKEMFYVMMDDHTYGEAETLDAARAMVAKLCDEPMMDGAYWIDDEAGNTYEV